MPRVDRYHGMVPWLSLLQSIPKGHGSWQCTTLLETDMAPICTSSSFSVLLTLSGKSTALNRPEAIPLPHGVLTRSPPLL